MGAQSGGSWATFLMSVPLAAIPLMAIFGIPQFAPVAASPDDEQSSRREPWTDDDSRDRNRRRSSDLLGNLDDRERADQLTDAPMYDPFRDDGVPAREPADPDGLRHRIARPTDSSLASAQDRTPASIGGRAREHAGSDWSGTMEATADQEASLRERAGAAAVTDGAAVWTETGGRESDSGPAFTWREAASQLSERGIEDFRLERGNDAESFLFVCTLSPGDAPHVTMRFEAEAIEPLAAVRNVLDQVDAWLRARFVATQGLPAGSGESR